MNASCASLRSDFARPGVVGARAEPCLFELGGHRLGQLPRRRVHDAGPVEGGHPPDQRAPLLALLVVALHLEMDVRPVEAADDQLGLAHVQALDDLLTDGR
jgi:hypothetical protein